MAPLDPHSYADSTHPLTNLIELALFLDFDSKIIHGSATLHLSRPFTGDFFLDTRSLHISVIYGKSCDILLPFKLSEPDAIKGSLLTVSLANQSSFTVIFRTDSGGSALQWLDPAQTAGGKLPYVFTQCQAIHARSIFPCQDTPAARIRYTAKVNVPSEMSVVMSAAHMGRASSGQLAGAMASRGASSNQSTGHELSSSPSLMTTFGSSMGACDDNIWFAEGRVVELFQMEQCIPPYLFAMAAGDITFADLSPRSRIYAEPPVLAAAAHEFSDTEAMMLQGETLFGPYEWERLDLVVMPPSFPYGGMENPRMVFLTPTVIVGDKSGVQVVAHELAHSWTGNLITNATNDDFWLNEVLKYVLFCLVYFIRLSDSSFKGISTIFDYLIPFPKALHMSSGNCKFNVLSSLVNLPEFDILLCG